MMGFDDNTGRRIALLPTAAACALTFFGAGAASAEAFVLVHGAWHEGSAWDGVAERLRAEGHAVSAPSMPARDGDGRAAAEVTMRDYVTTIEEAVRALAEESGQRVTLVGHSSAGFLLQQAAPAVADRLEQIVLNNAFILEDGTAQTDVIPHEIAESVRAAAAGNDGAVPPGRDFVRETLMAGDSEEEQERVFAILVPEPLALFDTPVETAAFADLDVPVAFVHLTEDSTLPSGVYQSMAEAAGAVRMVEMATGHEALFLEPDAFAEALMAVSADE